MMDYKKVAIGVAILVGICVGVYFQFFHRASTSDIMAANLARRNRGSRARSPGNRAHHGPPARGEDHQDTEDYYDYYEDEDDSNLTPSKKTAKEWNRWIDENNHVSIGELYDSCDGDEKIMLGRVIMLPDEKNGGIKSRTFLNVTLEYELTGGEMYIECQYNGKDLYSNHWELCTVEEGMDDQIIFCPIAQGKHKFVKDLPIPNYLPKGRYSTKAWMTDQDDKLIGCAYSDFTI